MTIQQVIANEQVINSMVLSNQMMDAFNQYYGDDVVMIQSDGTTFTGKADCQAMEESWGKNLVEFRESKLLSSVVMPSDDANYEFLVVATWFNDYTTTEFTMTGNQTSLCYWANDKIQKVTFKSPSEIIA
jgi:hypothetical protein